MGRTIFFICLRYLQVAPEEETSEVPTERKHRLPKEEYENIKNNSVSYTHLTLPTTPYV